MYCFHFAVSLRLTQSIYIVIRHHASFHLQELILVDEDVTPSREQQLAIGSSGDVELERW